MDPKIRALRLGKVFTGSQEVYHNYDYLLDKRNSKHCREYLPTPSLYMISICFDIEKNGGGGVQIRSYISRGFLLESPTRDPNSKFQLESPTRKSNSKVQLENPTRKSNSKVQLQNPTQKSNSIVQLESPTRKSNSKVQLESPTPKSNSKIQLESPT